MYVHNLDPIIAQIGPLAIRWYALPYLIGFLLAYWWLYRAIKQDRLGLNRDEVQDLMFYLILGTILGSRLGIVLWEPGFYLSNPLEIFKIWRGGMAFHGGLVGILATMWWYTTYKTRKLSFLELGDLLVIPATVGLALGRVGNFINGEIWGYPTNLPWCVVFPAVEGCRHPAQLYNGLALGIVLVGLIWLYRKRVVSGLLAWSFVLLTGLARFVTDFWREDTLYAGLSLGQWFSSVMIIVAAVILVKRYGKELKKLLLRRRDVSLDQKSS